MKTESWREERGQADPSPLADAEGWPDPRSARRYMIRRRRRAALPVPVVSPDDFFCRYDGGIDFRLLWRLAAVELTPYCLAIRERCVVFARTPAQTDLNRLDPFFYEAQRRQARELIYVPYEQVVALAARYQALEKDLIFLHSTGRCGSTLLCRLLGAVPEVQSISEPDFYSQAVILQARGEDLSSFELDDVLRACSLLLAAHRREREPDRPTVVIKLRGMCTYVADRLAAAMPKARQIFLYRNALDTTNSFLSAVIGPWVGDLAARATVPLPIGPLASAPVGGWRIRAIAPLAMQKDYQGFRVGGLVGLFALSWLSKMDRAALLDERDPNLFAARLRYEDLRAHGVSLAGPLLQSLGLRRPDLAEEAALEEILAQESQKGSRLASTGCRLLRGQDEARIHRLLQYHPFIKDSHYELPGSLGGAARPVHRAPAQSVGGESR